MSTVTVALLVVVLCIGAAKAAVCIGDMTRSIVTPIVTSKAGATPRGAVGWKRVPTRVIIVVIVVVPLAVASLSVSAFFVVA